jgi:hypothetical protein
MDILRCCYHQILGPGRQLLKFSNGLCRHAGACVRFNPHFLWQATESYVERSNAFALISGHGKSLLICSLGAPYQVMNSRRLLLTSSARVTSGRGTDRSGVQPEIGPDSGRRQGLAATRAPEIFSLLLFFPSCDSLGKYTAIRSPRRRAYAVIPISASSSMAVSIARPLSVSARQLVLGRQPDDQLAMHNRCRAPSHDQALRARSCRRPCGSRKQSNLYMVPRMGPQRQCSC